MLHARFSVIVVLLTSGCTHELSGSSDPSNADLGERSDAAVDERGPSGSCGVLGEDACRARTDCVADYCQACSCTPTYAGCRAPTDLPHDCPALGCADPDCCRDQESCGNKQLTCVRPDQPNMGISMDTNSRCNSDAQCAVGTSCVNGACAAQPDCSTPCGAGLVCDHDASGAACVHSTCTTDADCERGFCVIGGCYRSLGMCEIPAI
jgi:hypothetical protein